MRNISPETFSDEFFGRLAAEHRILLIGLVVRMADDQGRMLDNATLIAGSIFPYDSHIRDDIIEAGLVLFSKHKKIIRYRAGGNGSGRQLIQIVNWWRYQASAHWAARSTYPAPDRWVDRIRSHQGQQIITENWDRLGGLRPGGAARKPTPNTEPTQRQRRASVGPAKAQEEDDINNEVEDDKEISTLPPNPPTRQGERKAAGRHDQKKTDNAAFASLTPHQRDNVETINKIFALASFRDKRKAILLSVEVATRSLLGDPISRRVIPAFAAAYADDRVKDPTAVAITRLQNDEHNPAFEDPKTWSSVPPDLLHAAGIDNLTAYKVDRFIRGGG